MTTAAQHYGPVRWGRLGIVVVVVFGILIAISAWNNSPTIDELGHLPAGCAIWELGRFDVYKVNPPLVKGTAAIPVFLARPLYDWLQLTTNPCDRPEWNLGMSFVQANAAKSQVYFGMARLALIPFWVIGAAVAYGWARELFGRESGFYALALWCVSPNVMAWTGTLSADSTAASLGLLACFAFRGSLCLPGRRTSLLLGVGLGFALLSKLTWVILPAVLAVLILFCTPKTAGLRRTGLQLLMSIAVAIYVLNQGYAFQGTFRRLADFRFCSDILGGAAKPGMPMHGNRFRDSPLGPLRVPLPAPYLEGIDLQKKDFEERGWSYLRSEHQLGGWWYWYLYATCVKVPLGTLSAALLALAVTLRKLTKRTADFIQWRTSREDSSRGTTVHELSFAQEILIVWAPALAVAVLVSSQWSFTRYYRYLLPCFGFAFVGLSIVVSPLISPRPVRVAAWLFLLWSTISSLSVWPSSMSYFNELAGGPRGGSRHLIGSSIDWGQDLYRLHDWLEDHPEATVAPLYLAVSNLDDPAVYSIDYRIPPRDPRSIPDRLVVLDLALGPLPGWYAVSIHHLHGRDGAFRYLLEYEPTARIGYSIHIYHITPDDANRVRGMLGLPDVEQAE